jgi:Arc/MetJ family transcription regulator
MRDVRRRSSGYTSRYLYILLGVTKHLVDLDDDALSAARAELGTSTIKDTVNEALRRATSERTERIRNALDVLANATLDDRQDAWR